MATSVAERIGSVLQEIRGEYPNLTIGSWSWNMNDDCCVVNVECQCRHWAFVFGHDDLERGSVRAEFEAAARAWQLLKCQHAERRAGALTDATLHIAVAGGHCGDAQCEKCDPMERHVGGMTVRECLQHWMHYRDIVERGLCAPQPRWLSPLQLVAAKEAWRRVHGEPHSQALRARQQEEREKERRQVVCEPQDEP